MSKNIAISDEVYDRLTREKGDQSFSELIAATLDSGGQLADVTGQQVLPTGVYDEVETEIERLSEGTLSRMMAADDDR